MRDSVRDSQQAALYKWEEKWTDWNRTTMTLQECRDLVKWACRHFKLKISPRVKQNKNRSISYSMSDVRKPFHIFARRRPQEPRCHAARSGALHHR
jgi:hypothetical protein